MTSESVVFRQRVAEALSKNGLAERQVAAEVLLLLPEQFLTEYEVLWLEAWKGLAGGVRIGDENAESPVALKWRMSTSSVETRGTASVKGRGSTVKGLGIRSSRAHATKEWADRKLRKLAREIRARMNDEDLGIRRCTGAKCRRLAEDTWNYCPHCGSPTQDEETQNGHH